MTKEKLKTMCWSAQLQIVYSNHVVKKAQKVKMPIILIR